MRKITFMRKTIILFLLLATTIGTYAQSDYYDVLSGAGTSQNGRAPQGGRNICRTVYLITPAEMAAAGFVNGNVINSIGFTYQAAQDIPTSGNMVVYMENTANTTNSKSTTWATAITGMTTVSNGAVTIPNAAGEFNYPFTGGSTFTYTGGGVYIAFDYQNLVNPVATVLNTAYCNTALTAGLLGAMSAAGSTTPPTTLTASTFRPVTRLGKPVTCARPNALSNNTGATTTTSASLTWTPSGGGTVDLEYGAYGYTQGTGTTVTNVTSPYTLGGLTNSSVYDYYVRTNCGAGGNSTWAGPYAFNTTFIPANAPYNTSFEQEVLPFVGWTTPNVTAVAGDWAIGLYGAGPLVQNGVASVASVTPAAAAANNWMFSRGINLTSGSNVTVTYYISNYQSGTAATGNYQLTHGNAQTVVAQTNILATETGLNTAAFTLKTYNFTPSSTGVYYFGFRNNTPANAAGTHALIVDNFTVTELLSAADFISSKFSVYPNPANNIVTISNNGNIQINKVVITDVNGRTVKTGNFNGVTETQMNVSDLNTGVYFMNIDTNEGSLTKKIVKN
jgi:type IX secretion system substrate protein